MEKTHLQLWEECRQFIKDNIPSAQYDAWFRDVASLSFDNMSLTLVVPSAFFVEQLEERYLGLLGAAIRQVYCTTISTPRFRHLIRCSWI